MTQVSVGGRSRALPEFLRDNVGPIVGEMARLASIDRLDPNDVLGGADCGFETFASIGDVPCVVGFQKFEALAEGAAFACQRLGLA